MTFHHLLKQSCRNCPLKTNNQTQQTRSFYQKGWRQKRKLIQDEEKLVVEVDYREKTEDSPSTSTCKRAKIKPFTFFEE